MSIALRHITLAYGQRILLRDVSASVPPGSLTALIGRNGTGKSTLLRTVAGLGAAASGGIELCGKPLAALTPLQRASTVSFVTTDKVRIANLACEDVVALGRAPYTNWIGRMQETDRDIVARSIRLVGMEAFACKTMDRMSDGECQRILIARALAQDTPVILLDEPTAFLDLPNRYELATLLRRLAHDEGKCILFSTHDLDVALGLCDAVALIDTPDLHCLPASDMASSGHIERLFAGAGISFDPATLTIRLTKITNSIFSAFFVRLTFLFTFAPLKLPQGAAIVVKGPFVYRLGRKIFILERGVRLSYGLLTRRSAGRHETSEGRNPQTSESRERRTAACGSLRVILFESGPSVYPHAATAVYRFSN